MCADLGNIDVVILCGGKGERLRSVSKDLPKILVEVCGRPFINILIDNFLQFGFKRFILCTGYLKEQIKNHFYNTGYNVEFSEEDIPLGTGGALKNAVNLVKSSSLLVTNGDSICQTDFIKFYDFHINKNGIMTAVLAKPQTSEDYGVVSIDEDQRVTSFKEKIECNNRFVNAGIYLMQRDIFQYMPGDNHFSIEYDFFPKIIDFGCYGFISNSEVIDIGTPERYKRANQLLSEIC